MQAIVLADRSGAALAPLTDDTCAALLPLATKPLLAHCLDALSIAGIREVLLVVGPHAGRVERLVGNGTLWGLDVRYVLARGDEGTAEILRRLRRRLTGPVLLVRADHARGACIGPFLERARCVEGNVVTAIAGDTPAGVLLVRDASAVTADADGEPVPDAAARLADARAYPMASLADYHRANLDAAAGRFGGLLLPGRTIADGVRAGRASRVAVGSVVTSPAVVGRRCEVRRGAELHGPVVLCDDVVVDARARLQGTVVLPDTYVGEMMDLSDAIAWGGAVWRASTGEITQIGDPVLLGSLQRSADSVLAAALARIAGVVLLLLSLPLWPLALLASVAADRRAPLRHRLLCGRRAPYDALEFAAAAPILRHLPRVVALIRGDLALLGVEPLPPHAVDGLREPWQRVRSSGSAGLVGPWLTDAPTGASADERRVIEAAWIRSRSARTDARLLLRALGLVVHPASWSASSTRDPRSAGAASEAACTGW